MKTIPLLLAVILWAGPIHRAHSAILTVPPDGPAQMAVLYTHGFNDDGGSWGLGDLSEESEPIQFLSTIRNRYQNNTDTNIRLFAAYGVESYAVQWSAAVSRQHLIHVRRC